jgi:hypothetical protein
MRPQTLKNYPILGPNIVFFVWEMLLKSDHFFGALNKKVHQGNARRGMCPLLFGGLKGGGGYVPLIAKKILEM